MNEPFENEEVLTEYLLGGLSEESRFRIEQRFFADEHFEELLHAIEQELIYDYAQGGLTTSQREKFEKTFLRSAENRQRLEVARVLLQRLSAKPVHPTESSPVRPENVPWWRTLIPANWATRPFAAVYATAALLLIVGIAWLILNRNAHPSGGPQNQAAQHPSQTGSPNSQGNHPPANPQTATGNPQSPDHVKPNDASQLAALALVLEPGKVRDTGSSKPFVLSPEARSVNIQLLLRLQLGEEYTGYRATLLDPDDKTIWMKAALHSSQSSAGRVILLNVPAQALRTNDYKITLSGQTGAGAYEEVADYYFSVRRR